MSRNKLMFLDWLKRAWFWFFKEPLKDPPPPPPKKLTRAGWLLEFICAEVKHTFSLLKMMVLLCLGCYLIYWVTTSALVYSDLRYLAANDPASFTKFMAPKTAMAYRKAVRKQETTLLVKAFKTEFFEAASAAFEARYAETGKEPASKGHRADVKKDEANGKAEIQPPWYPPGFEKQSSPGHAQPPHGR